MRVWTVAAALLLAGPVLAEQPLADPAREREAKELMGTLRCVVCQSASIADSGAEMAADMRVEVRQRLAQGQTPAEVRKYLVSRYGAWISYSPPVEPATWLLWAAPIVFLGAGGLAARALFRRRAGAGKAA